MRVSGVLVVPWLLGCASGFWTSPPPSAPVGAQPTTRSVTFHTSTVSEPHDEAIVPSTGGFDENIMTNTDQVNVIIAVNGTGGEKTTSITLHTGPLITSSMTAQSPASSVDALDSNMDIGTVGLSYVSAAMTVKTAHLPTLGAQTATAASVMKVEKGKESEFKMSRFHAGATDRCSDSSSVQAPLTLAKVVESMVRNKSGPTRRAANDPDRLELRDNIGCRHESPREATQATVPSSRLGSLANSMPAESEVVWFATEKSDGVYSQPPPRIPARFDDSGITAIVAPRPRDRRWDLDSAVQNFPDQVVSDVSAIAGQVTSAAGPVASDAKSAAAMVTSALTSFESAAVSEGETFYSTVAVRPPTQTSAVSGARAGSAPLLAGPLLLVLLFLFHVVS